MFWKSVSKNTTGLGRDVKTEGPTVGTGEKKALALTAGVSSKESSSLSLRAQQMGDGGGEWESPVTFS